MNELLAGLVLILPALSLGAGGLALLPTRARTSGALLMVTAVGLIATMVAILSGHPTVAIYLVVGGLLPASLALLAYPAPSVRHPVDFCAWVIAGAGSVMAVAFVAVDAGGSGTVGSIVVMAVVAHAWLVLESGEERDRVATLWLSLAGLITVVALAPSFALEPNGDVGIAAAVVPAVALGPAMAIGIRRPELADIRSLVVSTVVLVVVAVGYLSVFLGADAVLELSGVEDTPPLLFAAIGLVLAAGFHPLRVVLRGLIDELLFGDRPDPLLAATAVADRIGDDPVLALRALREALVLPYASISTDGTEVARSGTPVTESTRVPLTTADGEVGEMTVGLRPGQLRLSAEDQHVLRIVGALLTQTLRARSLADEVSESRAAAILAIEDERRRLRRDLHDGLGPTLSGIAHTAAAARNSISGDPAAADELLGRLRADAAAAVGEVRRLVYDMRPPALDELGLVAALHQQFATVRTPAGGPMRVTIDVGDLPPLPASIEVAAYRIATEAVTNAALHSGGDEVWLGLGHEDGHLVVVVRDAGSSPETWVPGVGVASMRERTSEVGGTIEITGGQRGSSVRARLPLI